MGDDGNPNIPSPNTLNGGSPLLSCGEGTDLFPLPPLSKNILQKSAVGVLQKSAIGVLNGEKRPILGWVVVDGPPSLLAERKKLTAAGLETREGADTAGEHNRPAFTWELFTSNTDPVTAGA
jgi:hypothetical protein